MVNETNGNSLMTELEKKLYNELKFTKEWFEENGLDTEYFSMYGDICETVQEVENDPNFEA